MDRPREAGRCDTTMTMRFAVADCECDTYADNLGPCAFYSEGMTGRCVYCDHGNDCHLIGQGSGTEIGTGEKGICDPA